MTDIFFSDKGYKLMSKFLINGLPFLIILAYPPLVFTNKLPDTLRITLFLLLILYLLSKTKILLYRHVINLSILIIFMGVIFFRINFENQLDLSNGGSFFLTLVFAIALDRASTNSELSAGLVKFYIFLFTLIPILMIFAIGWYFVFGELNLFNLFIGEVGSNQFLYTPFGALLPKFTGSEFLRSTNFFHEPVLVAFFLAINTFLPVTGSGFCARNFNKLNFVGGVLTLSFLYIVIVLFALYWRLGDQLKIRVNKFFLGFVIIFILIVLEQSYQFLGAMSSMHARLDRASLYLSLYPTLSISELWLGSGLNPVTDLNNAINTGVITLLYKFGIVGLISILTLIWMLTRNNTLLFLACLFPLFIYEPYLFPLFWLAITAYVVVSRQSSRHDQNSANFKVMS
jgi:hypothetical protein